MNVDSLPVTRPHLPPSGAAPYSDEILAELLEYYFRESTDDWYIGVRKFEKVRGDGLIARLPLADGKSVVLKLWKKPGWKGLVRRLSGTSSSLREWNALRRLSSHGASVPGALGYGRVPGFGSPYTEALFLEDLGPVTWAPTHMIACMEEGRPDDLEVFFEDMVRLTRELLDAGVVDTDHSVNNTVILPGGRPIRLDFECAHCTRYPRLRSRPLGLMLGRLLATVILVVQPEVERAESFARRLVESFRPSGSVLAIADRYIGEVLAEQAASSGIDTRFSLRG